MNNKSLPKWWQSTNDELAALLKTVKKAQIIPLAKSAGRRDIVLLNYGATDFPNRTANYSSALGAGDITCFADKKGTKRKPCLLLVGTIHGGEFEGQMALMNLISILETGCDLSGRPYPEIERITDSVGIIILPCANPDGRIRVPFESVYDMSFEKFRYYNQGTWKDGSLCGWPECKKVHPIKEYVDYLGGYFNDDGINMMHDDFFAHPCCEVQNILDTVIRFVPELSILLHGGTNCHNCMLKTPSGSKKSNDFIGELDAVLEGSAQRCGLDFVKTPHGPCNDERSEFNLLSAMHYCCGGAMATFESNQGLSCENQSSMENIYKMHLLLFETAARYLGGNGVIK